MSNRSPQPSTDSANSAPATRASLIDRLQASDPIGWQRLIEFYRPLICHWAKRCGAAVPDCDDVCQEVFRVVVQKICSFRLAEREGSFRTWLRGITRNVTRERIRANGSVPPAPGGTDAAIRLHEIAAPSADEADPPDLVADLLRRTIAVVRGEFSANYWTVFERLTFDERSATEVAAELGLAEATVRKIKSRVYRRLREELGDVVSGAIKPANA